MCDPVVISLIVSSAATAGSAVQQRRAAKSAEKEAQLSNRQAEITNQRNIRRAIASARADRAALVASGFAQTGGFDSSSLAGGAAAADTQVASNVGFARQAAGASRRSAELVSRQAAFQRRSTTFGAVGNVGGQIGLLKVS